MFLLSSQCIRQFLHGTCIKIKTVNISVVTGAYDTCLVSFLINFWDPQKLLTKVCVIMAYVISHF